MDPSLPMTGAGRHRPDRLIVISDVHMAGGDSRDGFCRDEELAGLLDALGREARQGREETRLLVLGDLLDLFEVRDGPDCRPINPLDTSTSTALAKLRSIARAHAVVFRALGTLAAAGVGIDVVAGNHDLELMRPPVQEELCELLMEASGEAEVPAALRFYPWIYYLPGLVYAEHGSQFHDINWSPTLLRNASNGKDVQPPVSHLLLNPRPLLETAGPLGALRVLLRHDALRLRPRRSGARAEYRRQDLPAYAPQSGLAPELLLAIDDACSVRLLPLASRLARAIARGRGRRSGAYLKTAAAAVHGVLESAGAGVPFYLFGHSHLPERAPLFPPEPSPGYLNVGTWSRFSGFPDRLGTFVEITPAAERPASARLLVWDSAARKVRAFSP
ncbi:MAG: hypothetical protein ACRDJF_10180 [Actinomycetota bacterium]